MKSIKLSKNLVKKTGLGKITINYLKNFNKNNCNILYK